MQDKPTDTTRPAADPPADVACCGGFEELAARGYNAPFVKPIVLNRNPPNLAVGDWAVTMMKITDRGTIRRGQNATLFLNYCPFCGERLRKQQTP